MPCQYDPEYSPDEAPYGEPGVLNPHFAGKREFLADFLDSLGRLDNLSLDLRPDAISFDYKKAFSVGPIAQSDSSDGLVSWVWYVRVDNSDPINKIVYIARENDSKSEWGLEFELFRFTDGINVDEIDLAFEQSGNAVVCCERGGHIWLYWFDSSIGNTTITDFGVGRTPRVILDSPLDVEESDVLLFYINDTTDTLEYRQQRDRYAIAYATPVTAVANTYIQDVVKSKDTRLQVLYVVRDPVTGKYIQAQLESTLYRQLPDLEAMSVGIAPEASELLILIIQVTNLDIEAFNITSIPQNSKLGAPIIDITVNIESNDVGSTPQNSILAQPIINYTADINGFDVSTLPRNSTLTVIIITATAFNIEALNVTTTPQPSTLA